MKPTNLYEWATSGAALITEPALAQKQAGWVPLDRPPAHFLNWLSNGVHEWIKYLNDFEAHTHDWIDENYFQGAVEFHQQVTFLGTTLVTFNSKPTLTTGLEVTGGNVEITDDLRVDGSIIVPTGEIGTTSGDIRAFSGNIVAIDGDIIAANGNVTVNGSTSLVTLHPTAKIRHSSAFLERAHVALGTLRPEVVSGALPSPGFFTQSSHGIQAVWASLSAGQSKVIGGDFRIPSGAFLTHIGFFLRNDDTSPRTMNAKLILSQHEVATIASSYWNPSGAAGESIIVVNGGAGWYEFAVNDTVPLIGTKGVDLCLALTLPMTTSDSQFALCGTRVKYNFQDFARCI